MATLNEMKKRFKSKPKPKATKPQRSSRLVDRIRAQRREEEAGASTVDDRLVHGAPGAGKEPIKRKFVTPGGRYEPCTTDGDRDGILLFGKYKDERKKISELAVEGKGYLMWICTKHDVETKKGEPGFKPVLIEIIKEWVERVDKAI